MCFSAEASFAGGVIISSVGIAAIRKVQKPAQMPFASISLMFGVQQLSEGVVWLALSDPKYVHLQNYGMYLFLFMARVLWPVMMPLSVLFMEENLIRKKILWSFVALGSTVSLYYIYCLFFLNVTPHIAEHHILYISDFSESLAVPVFIIYFIASLTPLFISSVKGTKAFGVLLFLSAVITMLLFTQYLTSVWCFFAAVISGVIYWILNDVKSTSRPAA